jgi:hypothetical protein
MDRMSKNLTQLVKFVSSRPQGCDSLYLSAGDQNQEMQLFSMRQVGAEQLLPPAFLVPAIIEAFRGSKYESLVHVVPGEADAFCAKHLAEHGGVVLTSDSDLLVHDIGAGRVVFFRDVYLDPAIGARCLIFDPAAICAKLKLSEIAGLRRLGYELLLDRDASVPQLVRTCARPPCNDEKYDEFCREYLHQDVAFIPQIHDESLRLDNLDPRIAELVLQLLQLISDEDPSEKIIRVYLPVLIENPSRGTAWEPSTPVRQLAYSVLASVVSGRGAAVQEYRRVQSTVQKGREIARIPTPALPERITDLLTIMRQVDQQVNLSSDLYWVILSLILEIRHCEAQGKQSLSLTTINTLPRAGSILPWDMVHFVAQIQADLYSWRLLQQILKIVPKSGWHDLPPETTSLYQDLRHLPPLSKVLDFYGMLNMLRNAKPPIKETLGKFVTIPTPLPAGEITQVGKKRKRSKNKDNNLSAGGRKPKATSGNIFEMLRGE